MANFIGVVLHGLAIVARWQGSGFWPTSNMYEFIGFMAFSSMVAFLVLHRMYQLYVLGALVTPVTIALLAYSYVFPARSPAADPGPAVHLAAAARQPGRVLGEGFFAVAFGDSPCSTCCGCAGWSWLRRGQRAKRRAWRAAPFPRRLRLTTPSGVSRWERIIGVRAMEVVFYLILVVVGFTVLALVLRYAGFAWVFNDGMTDYTFRPSSDRRRHGGGEGSFLGHSAAAVRALPFGWRG